MHVLRNKARVLLCVVMFMSPLLIVPAAAAVISDESSKHATTLVIFSDRTMTSELWEAIESSLRSELASSAHEMQSHTGQREDLADPESLQVLRGDRLALGIKVETAISIYLHGDCDLALHPIFDQPRHIVGHLGWVQSMHGEIEPFINVDCSLIRQLIAQRALFLNQDQRGPAMATAVARVILHEWIHIATQTASHSRHGLAKAVFNADDLIAPMHEAIAAVQTITSPPTSVQQTSVQSESQHRAATRSSWLR